MARYINKSGTAVDAIYLLAQAGALTRRMLSRCMTRPMRGTEYEIPLVRNANLSKVVTKLKELEYISQKESDGTAYLYLTEKGWDFVDREELDYCPCMRCLSAGNAGDFVKMARHGKGMYIAQTMGVYCLTQEKPSFGSFIKAMGTNTMLAPCEDLEKGYNANCDLDDLLDVGVFYSIDEIRTAMAQSTNTRLSSNSFISIGAVFFKDRIAILLPVSHKMSPNKRGAERNFYNTIAAEVEGYYRSRLLVDGPTSELWLLTSSDYLVPSIFHGIEDGVVKWHRSRKKQSDEKLAFSPLSINRLRVFDRIYIIPASATDTVRRASFLNEERTQAEADAKNNIIRKHGKSIGDFVLVNFPNFIELMDVYDTTRAVNVIGPDDPVWVDAISRCLRSRLMRYYSLTTLDPVPITRYSNTGRPLKGNTQSIDYNAPLMFRPISFKSNVNHEESED